MTVQSAISRLTGLFGPLSGNPVAVVTGLKTMEILRRHLDPTGVPYRIVGHPTLFEVVFTDRDVRDHRDVLAADADRAVLQGVPPVAVVFCRLKGYDFGRNRNGM